MANILKGEVDLPLADKRTLTLVFDMDALIEAESAFGQPMKVVVAQAEAGFMGAVRALLYGALRARHPEITMAETSAILVANTEEITLALTRALDEAMPDPASTASAGGKAAAPVKPRRGATSGGSGARRSSTRKRSGG